MKDDIIELQKKFNEIKKKGWIKAIRKDDGGIGRTFEDLLDREENSLEFPDFNSIEIKTKRSYSNSYIGLFNMTPSGKYYHEVERLKNEFGYPDSELKQHKVLRASIYCNKRVWVECKYQFMLQIDKDKKRIYLLVFDVQGILIEKDVYWDFDILEEKLYRKLKTLAVIKAIRKFVNKEEYFKYYEMKIYTLTNFDTFVTLIEQGIIRITFKIGIFKTGKRKGQIHDHGTSFDIQKKKFIKII